MTSELKQRIDWVIRDVLLYGMAYSSKLTAEEINKIRKFHVNELLKIYENNSLQK